MANCCRGGILPSVKPLFISAIIFFLAAPAVFAAGDGGSPLFRKARDFYAAGQYDSTIALIREHLRKNGRDPESYTLVPLITEAYMRKGDYAQSLRLIDMYKQKFADAPFIPRLTYLEGVACAREAKPAQALTSFSKALELGISAELFNLALAGSENICGRSLSVDELTSLSGKGELHPVLLEVVRFYEAQKLAAAGQVVRARNSAEEFRKNYPRSRYTEQIKELLARLSREKRGAGPVQVGLLSPMTGEDAEIGKYILQGVKLALDNHNARTQNPLKLIVYDTKGNAVETARKSKDLVTKDQAQICIGPILSNTAAVSAAMFSGKDIVMITPTANEDGISSIGDNIFQMNVSVGTIARKLARYALDNLNIREFAVIAPNSAFGYAMAEAFKEELGRHSIEVVHEEYFTEGIHDFTPVLKRMRHALLCRKLEMIASERGNTQKRITQVSRADSARYADSTLAVGGLFMPLMDYEDVVKLAPQAVFHRIRTQMLGTGGWHDPRVPVEGKRYVSNAIISIGIQPDQSSENWKSFAGAYKARYNSDPNRIAALGYDAAQLVIKIVEETGGNDMAKLKKAMTSIQNYNGLSGKISFDPQTGANSEAIIMKVTETGFMRVQ